mmetsp:Transcript_11541/g.37934  ORF Transcript_11541/g.37934 Transcript_11541/m.37934 type:complete len:115 (+) Transcript_11541:45-389(+)
MMRAQLLARRSLVNLPNRVQEYRKPFVANAHLHGADNPTYLKKGKVDEYIAWGGRFGGASEGPHPSRRPRTLHDGPHHGRLWDQEHGPRHQQDQVERAPGWRHILLRLRQATTS